MCWCVSATVTMTHGSVCWPLDCMLVWNCGWPQVEGGKNMDDHDVVLPAPSQNQTLTCVAVTPTFIITGSKQVGM